MLLKKENNPPKENKPPLYSYAKYSGIAFQMVAIIIIGVFGGMKIDKFFGLKFPVFTVVLSILSVFFAIYYVIRDLLK